jgi:cytochrome c biogenesis protein CcmG/thiol:disulfide interchange protein DsbE
VKTPYNIVNLLRRVGLMLLFAFVANSNTTAATDFDLREFHGKVVVLDFWASWCVPCRRSFPWMNSMQDKYGDEGLVIIGVNLDAVDTDAQAFLKETPADFRIVSDPQGTLARKHDVIAMPTSYIFDRDGNLVTRHLGFKVKRQGEYEALLVETLNRKTE